MTGLMRLRRTTWHENRGQRSTTAAGQSVWYKHRWKAIAWRSRFSLSGNLIGINRGLSVLTSPSSWLSQFFSNKFHPHSGGSALQVTEFALLSFLFKVGRAAVN